MFSRSQHRWHSTCKRTFLTAIILLATLLLSAYVQNTGAPATSQAAAAPGVMGDPSQAAVAPPDRHPEDSPELVEGPVKGHGQNFPTRPASHSFLECGTDTATDVFDVNDECLRLRIYLSNASYIDDVLWYDPQRNQTSIGGSIIVIYNYSSGILVSADYYFYIGGNREPGEYKAVAEGSYGFTDYFVIGPVPPALSDLPDQTVLVNSNADDVIDLWTNVYDADSADSELTFTIDNTPDPGAGISIDGNRYVDINPVTDWTGQTIVIMLVMDPGGLFDTSTFTVTVRGPVSKTWNGSTSSDWHSADNWTPTGVPIPADDVIIADAANALVIPGGGVVVNNLTINSGAVLDLTDRTLPVEGVLTNNGTLKQTQDVRGSNAAEFLRVTNQAGDQTKYYGVVITPSTGLAQSASATSNVAVAPAAASEAIHTRLSSGEPASVPTPDRARVAAALQSAPLMFIENAGQFDERARFQVRGGNSTLWLAEDGLWITLLEPTDPNIQSSISSRRGVNLKLSFAGANPHLRLEPFNRLETSVNHFLGDDPSNWRSDVPAWGGVRYVDLYPGVDLEVTGKGGHWIWRLVTRHSPFAISDVRLRVDGAESLGIVGEHLRLTTTIGDFTLPLLHAVAPDGTPLWLWTERPPQGRLLDLLAARPQVNGNEITAPFSLSSSLPPLSPLASDPTLNYSTFVGGSRSEGVKSQRAMALALDGAGNVVVTGETWSSDFPTTAGAYDTSHNEWLDVYVSKLAADGGSLLYSTFVGGNGLDEGYALALDNAGNAVVTGRTNSSDFPHTAGAYDTTYSFFQAAFVLKLAADGGSLLYSTFVRGSDYDQGFALALDDAGNVVLMGCTESSDFPTTVGAYDTSFNGGGSDVFVLKLAADGGSLLYSTFVGGSGTECGGAVSYSAALALDDAGNVVVIGWTESPDFPTTAGAYDTSFNGGYKDVFVFKLAADGGSLLYSTFVGGSDDDYHGSALVLDGAGNVIVTGSTYSSDFPTTAGAYDTSHNGYSDVFVLKLTADGGSLLYSTLVGKWGEDSGRALALDGSGNVVVTGYTNSSDFPTTAGAYDTSHNGREDVFVSKLAAGGGSLLYSTFVGGSKSDEGYALALDDAGNVIVAGWTESSDFPTTAGAYDTSLGGSSDVFVLRFGGLGGADTPIAGLTATNDGPTEVGQATTLTATVTAGRNAAYTWAFGDGSTGSDSVVMHTFPAMGVYPVVGVYTAIVTASNSLTVITATTTVTITAALIDVSPTFFEETVRQGGVATQTLIISNSGAAPLTFEISEPAAWLSENPISSTVLAGGSLPVDIVFDATGLAPGDYTANLIINSNSYDPVDTPLVPIVMHVMDSNVTVSISGNQFCAGRVTGVRRCFDIDASALDASMRFYFGEAERNEQTLDNLLVFHYNDDWTEEPGPYTRGGAGDAQYVQVQNVAGLEQESLFTLDVVTPRLEVTKQAEPDVVQSGAQLTYTIRVTNTGNVDLHATVTDTLPSGISPGQTSGGTAIVPGEQIIWTTVITTSGGIWTETVVVTVEVDYVGPLTNVVQVTTVEGATDVYTETSAAVIALLNQAPYTPGSPIPADGATDVPITQTLRWQGGDPDGDPVTYIIALGASDPPPFATTTTLTSYTPTALVTNTTYYWVITATDDISTSVGPVWRCTTVGPVEYPIYLPLMLRNLP